VGNDKEIIDFQALREKKENQAETAVSSLYHDYMTFLYRELNIREKVRAKHLFCNLAEIPPETLRNSEWEACFFHWLAFDYKNITGGSLLQLYLDQHKKITGEHIYIIGALLMASVIEPAFANEQKSNKNLIVESTFEGGLSSLKGLDGSFSEIEIGDLIFIRKVRLAQSYLQLGPIIKIPLIKQKGILQRLQNDYGQMKFKNDELTWRAFLKLHVVKYVNEGNIIKY
jgi:hypothetical protein